MPWPIVIGLSASSQQRAQTSRRLLTAQSAITVCRPSFQIQMSSISVHNVILHLPFDINSSRGHDPRGTTEHKTLKNK